jgi:hypothetical protein
MAFLDISDVLLDPSFTDTFQVQRRLETVDINGRSTTRTSTSNTFGVVTAASPNDLSRLPDADVYHRVLSVVTQFKLRGETADGSGSNWKPDLIVWRGNSYIVKEVDLYPQFGAGFVQAICASEDLVDMPATEVIAAFNQKYNSSYLGII